MTQKHKPNNSTAGAIRQAADWGLRLKHLRRLSLGDAVQFTAWLARSREHLHEFLLFRRLDGHLTRLLRAKWDQSNVTHVDFWRGSSLYPPMQGRRRIGVWSVAATAFAILCAIFISVRMSSQSSDRWVTTAPHEVKTQQLDDGSEVSLGADSTLRVQFTDVRRDVQLSQGNAMFDVMMDMKRPFVVSTSVVDIAAVESRFSVTIDTSVEVRVYEGMVAISGRGMKAGAAVVTVKKGETYRVPVAGSREMVADGGAAPKAQQVEG